MKTNIGSQFEYLHKLLNPNNLGFETVFVCVDYGVNTLINGNVSECINYLRALIGTGLTGINIANDELFSIKSQCPERFDYIKDKVFSVK